MLSDNSNNSGGNDVREGRPDALPLTQPRQPHPPSPEGFDPTIIHIPSNLDDAVADASSGSHARNSADTEMVDTGDRRPRNTHATDVVVEPAVVNSREGVSGGDGEEQSLAAATAHAQPRSRTMGEVYSIMKNTIYEDEECDGEVRLGAMDCGARFIRYINGLFQYLVRNPKTMGFLFTTAVVLLFFKYSQQVVVRSVNSALHTHPGLEPSDELRSGVLAFTTEMRAFESVARTLQWAYLRNGVVGYDLATAADSTFLALAASLQQSFAANQQTYVLYQIPADKTSTGKMQWGQIGCLEGPRELHGVPLCYHIAADGTAVSFRGTNTSDVVSRVPNAYADDRMMSLTELVAIPEGSKEAREGVWSRPLVMREPFNNSTNRVIGYMLPIAFDAHATTLVGVDVRVEDMAAAVSVGITNIEVVMTDSRFMAEQGGQFVLDTFEPGLYWDEVHASTETPSHRINEITRPIARRHRSSVMVNASFYEDGLIYESLTMMDRWALLAASPMVLSSAEVKSAFRALLDEYVRVTEAASQVFTECQRSAEAQSDNIFLEAVGRFEETFGSRIHSLYVAYGLEAAPPTPSSSSAPSSSPSATSDDSSSSASSAAHSSSGAHPGTSSSSTKPDSSAKSDSSTKPDSSTKSDSTKEPGSNAKPDGSSGSNAPASTRAVASDNGRDSVSQFFHPNELRGATAFNAGEDPSGAGYEATWGSCGCSYGGSNDPTAYTCFYTDGDGLETYFDGAVRSSAKEVHTMRFATTRQFQFVNDHIRASNATTAFWTQPYRSFDILTGETINAMSFVLPFRFAANGSVTAAAVFDLTMDWLPDFLSHNTHAGTSGVLLIDRRGEGTFMGSRSFRADGIYPAMSTPNATINAICKSVFERAGSSFNRSISFHEGPRLINYQLIEPYWGIIEQMPADVALARFLPTPTVTGATDALRLIPTGETIELFLYVAGILLCYFLNLLVLGCSKLGKQEKAPPAGTAQPNPSPTRSSALSDASSSAATTSRASAWT